MKRFILAAFISLVLPSSPALCQVDDPTPTPSPTPFPHVLLDFDGSGISSSALLTVLSDDGSKNNIVYDGYLGGDNEYFSAEFGKNNPAPGEYTGDGVWDLGSVEPTAQEDASVALVWRVRDSISRETSEEIFGLEDDTAISGCDMDADGISDKIFLRGKEIHLLFSSTAEEGVAALALPEAATIHNLACPDFDGDGHPELAAVVSVAESSSSAVQCKKPNSRKCKKKKKQPNSSERKYSLRVVTAPSADSDDSFESVELRSSDLDAKPEGLLSIDTNADSSDECVTYGKARAKVARMSIYSAIAEEPEQIELPMFVDASPGIFEDGPGVLLVNKKRKLRRYNFESGEATELTDYFEGEKLAKGVNVTFTGAVNPIDPDRICSEIYPAQDGAYGFLVKNSDYHPGIAVVIPGEFRTPFERTYIMRDGKELYSLYFAGMANPDIINGKPVNRQHWRYAGTYAQNIPDGYFVVGVLRGISYCWYVPESLARVD